MRRLQMLALLGLASACTAIPDVVAPAHLGRVASEPASYVALGDSLATGAGSQRGYAERYAALVDGQTDTPLHVVNLARDGWTSADLLAALRDDRRFGEALADADLVTVNIGGNDLLAAQGQVLAGACGDEACLQKTVDTFKENWDAILAEVDALVAADARLVTMDIYNPFVAALRAYGLLDRLQPFLDAVNDHIRASAAAHGMAVAPVHSTFNGEDGMGDPVPEGLIAPDHVHPSDEGHAAIADVLVQTSRGL